jgi:Arc/MetJ-type ribon-helix-helix transcriptional regulator
MSVPLAPTTEQRIEREMARGIYREPDEVVNRALDLLESQEDWLLRDKDSIRETLEESWAEYQRGEFHTPEEVRAVLAQDREARAAARK